MKPSKNRKKKIKRMEYHLRKGGKSRHEEKGGESWLKWRESMSTLLQRNSY